MKHSPVILTILCVLPFGVMAADMLFHNFTTDPRSDGWTYTGNSAGWTAADGFIRCEAGKEWRSPRFPVTAGQYCRIECRSRAPQSTALLAAVAINHTADWGRLLSSQTGELVADDYTSVQQSSSWQGFVLCTRGGANADSMYVRFQATESELAIDDVLIRSVDTTEVALWADTLFAAMVPLNAQFPADRLSPLPRTLEKLRSRSTLRIVLLGDSIMNDTGNSACDALLERMYPGLKIEIIITVGGGCGVDKWNHPDQYPQHDLAVQKAVIAQEPDLVMIGGISNPETAQGYDDMRQIIDTIRSGVRQSGGDDVDIMLLSGAFGQNQNPLEQSSGWYRDVDPQGNDYRSNLYRIAGEKQAAFLDMRGVWGQYMVDYQHAGFGFGSVYRDIVHANASGKQILGRILERFFSGVNPGQQTHSSVAPERNSHNAGYPGSILSLSPAKWPGRSSGFVRCDMQGKLLPAAPVSNSRGISRICQGVDILLPPAPGAEHRTLQP
jgi:hypothetical protein